MDCSTLETQATPYIDGDIAPEAREAVESHLRVCSPCHARVAAERSVRELIRARRGALTCQCAPAALRVRCAGRAIAAGRPAPWRTRVVPFVLAAGVLLVVGGTFVNQIADRSSRVLIAELAADHLKCLALNGVLRVDHTPPAAVEISMRSSFGWDVQLPQHPERAGLELVAFRPCLYGKGRIAHLMYRSEGRAVSVFMLPKTTRPTEFVDALGYQAAIWSTGGRTFVVMARGPRPEVQRIAAFVQAAFR